MDLMLIVFFIALILILSGAIYKKLQAISITEPFIALLTGILVGPDVLNLIHSAPDTHEFHVLKIACEFTIAMALMAAALRLPQDFFRKNVQTASILVVIGMVLMWLLSSVIFYLVFPNFPLGLCLLLGAIISPTDPVIASTIIGGKKAKKYLPSFLRNNLSFESGINDGLAFSIVFLSLLFTGMATFDLSEWATRIFLYENLLCAVLAYFVGTGAGLLMKKAHQAGFMNKKTILPFSLAVALFLLSGFNVLRMNGIIAVFAGSLAFARDITAHEELEEKHIQESMERMTTTPVFFILGLMIPWEEWYTLGWKAIAIPVLILLFRRIPALLVLMPLLPKFKNKIYSSLIMGWFGPIGVATLYYALLMKEKAGMAEAWILPSLIVAASTVIHGLTSVPFSKWYHKKALRANEFSKDER